MGEVLRRQGQDDEALTHLARAYRGVPIAKLKAQAPRYARPLSWASGGSAQRLLDAVPEEEHRAWFLASLPSQIAADELPGYFAVLAEEPAPRQPRLFVGRLRHAPGPEGCPARGISLGLGQRDPPEGWVSDRRSSRAVSLPRVRPS